MLNTALTGKLMLPILFVSLASPLILLMNSHRLIAPRSA